MEKRKCIKCGEDFMPVVTEEDTICGVCLILMGDEASTNVDSNVVIAISRIWNKLNQKGGKNGNK